MTSRLRNLLFLALLLCAGAILAARLQHTSVVQGSTVGTAGPPTPAAGSARQQHAVSVAAFEAIVPVLHNPRCMNCHMRGDFPRQGDDDHPHIMQVRRGPDGHGAAPVRCSTCHQDHNLAGIHMPPGAPDWALPPPATPMIWQDLSDRQLCELLKDPGQNGHRTVAQIVEHMGTPLVLWGWHPGQGRTPISTPQAVFLYKVNEWAANGAACPAG